MNKQTLLSLFIATGLLTGCTDIKGIQEHTEVYIDPITEAATKEVSEKLEGITNDVKEEVNWDSITSIIEQVKDETASLDTLQEAYLVDYVRSRDGDTQVFEILQQVSLNNDTGIMETVNRSLKGQELVVRDLLVNSPEVAKPDTPAEPFADEAAAFSDEIFSNAQTILLTYDIGDRTDKYDRHLMYIWVDGELYQELLLREGLAEVRYVYEPNTTYLKELEAAQAEAISQNKGIWK